MNIDKSLLSIQSCWRCDGEWYYDKSALVGFWTNIGDIVVVDYDSAMLKYKDIIPSFLETLGVNFNQKIKFAIWENKT